MNEDIPQSLAEQIFYDAVRQELGPEFLPAARLDRERLLASPARSVGRWTPGGGGAQTSEALNQALGAHEIFGDPGVFALMDNQRGAPEPDLPGSNS